MPKPTLAVDNDLPKELREQLSKQFLSGGTSSEQFLVNLNTLFEENGKLNLDEIILAWYRKYSEIIKRPATSTRLNKLAKEGLITKHGRTNYGLKKEEEASP